MNVLLLAAEPRPRAELEEWLKLGGHNFRAAEPGPTDQGDTWRADLIVVWLPRLLETALARCRELRHLPAATRARILTVGTWDDLDEIRSLLEAGADDYLTWPSDPDTFRLRLLVLEEEQTRHPLTDDQRRLQERVAQSQKLEGLTTLASGIAHDFNNLLAAILGNAELALLDLNPQSPVRYSLEQIEKASRRAAELTRQMLTYSGRTKSETKPLNLGELVQEMSELLRISISKRCRIEYCFDTKIPSITGDASQLRQVVMNLLINASEATAGKEGCIQVRTTVHEAGAESRDDTLSAGTLKPGRYVVLEVADNGAGMDEATLSRIFDPFFTTKKPGRGLGLAAVLGVVLGHQGAIKVHSRLGKGTVFEVYFPVVESTAAVGGLGAAEIDWRGSGTILLIDDEEAVREAARRLLEKAGYTVLAATNGEMGLEIFRDFHSEICAVILDLSMPGMDGMDVFLEIRRISQTMRVIVWSGFDEKDVRERLTGLGVSLFIEKPSHVKDLALALKRALAAPI